MNATTIKKIKASTASGLIAYMKAHNDRESHPDKISSVFNAHPYPFFGSEVETSIITEFDIAPVKGFEANHVVMAFELYFTGVSDTTDEGLLWDGMALVYGCDLKTKPIFWYHKDECGVLTEIKVTESEITDKYFVEETIDLLMVGRDVLNNPSTNKVYQNIFKFAVADL